MSVFKGLISLTLPESQTFRWLERTSLSPINSITERCVQAGCQRTSKTIGKLIVWDFRACDMFRRSRRAVLAVHFYIFTGDETRVHHAALENQMKSMIWKQPSFPHQRRSEQHHQQGSLEYLSSLGVTKCVLIRISLTVITVCHLEKLRQPCVGVSRRHLVR